MTRPCGTFMPVGCWPMMRHPAWPALRSCWPGYRKRFGRLTMPSYLCPCPLFIRRRIALEEQRRGSGGRLSLVASPSVLSFSCRFVSFASWMRPGKDPPHRTPTVHQTRMMAAVKAAAVAAAVWQTRATRRREVAASLVGVGEVLPGGATVLGFPVQCVSPVYPAADSGFLLQFHLCARPQVQAVGTTVVVAAGRPFLLTPLLRFWGSFRGRHSRTGTRTAPRPPPFPWSPGTPTGSWGVSTAAQVRVCPGPQA
jgi:hypothetical protein